MIQELDRLFFYYERQSMKMIIQRVRNNTDRVVPKYIETVTHYSATLCSPHIPVGKSSNPNKVLHFQGTATYTLGQGTASLELRVYLLL